MATCLIGLGANLGDRAATLDAAVERLARLPRVQLGSHSRWLDTKAVGGPAEQPGFLNGAAVIEIDLPPAGVVQALLAIESQFGRKRTGRWRPRELDLDLLLYDELVVSRSELTVPHPWMAVRRFVLEPAVEVAPAMLHPPTGWSVARLLENLNRAHQYVAVASSDDALARRFAAALADRCSAVLLRLQPGPTTASASGSSAGQSWLELARCWAAQLAPERWPPAAVPRGATWVVTERWMGEALVAARIAHDSPSLSEHSEPRLPAEISTAWSEVTSRAVMPKLILSVERSHPPEAAKPSAHRTDYAARLAAELAQPGYGPVLRLSAADWDRAVDNGSAALAAAT
jgi:2-amino-4-hydroxy-6-hydroxymethyldihydropteridine diphosphokinase